MNISLMKVRLCPLKSKSTYVINFNPLFFFWRWTTRVQQAKGTSMLRPRCIGSLNSIKLFLNLHRSVVKSFEMLYICHYIFIKNLIFHGYCCIKKVDRVIKLFYFLLLCVFTFLFIFCLWFLIPYSSFFVNLYLLCCFLILFSLF